MAQNISRYLNIRYILTFALIFRLVLLPLIYHGDITVTYYWGKFAEEFSWRGFYDWLNFGGYSHPDQPMLNIYYDWLIREVYLFLHQILWWFNTTFPLFPSKIMSWFFLEGNQVMLKFPMILADLGIIYFFYRLIHTLKNRSTALVAAIILAFYPPLFYNSALWGSGDSIINLLGLLSIYSLYKSRYRTFCLLFLTSILYKSSLLIWLPIILVMFIRQKPSLSTYFRLLVLSLIIIYLVSYPFAPVEINPIYWFFSTMTTKVLPGTMPQLTANAFNLWALLFGIAPKLDELVVIPFLSARNISLIICSLFYLPTLLHLYRHYNFKNVLLSLTNISLITFVFMTRMHERYTFPALLPLFLLCFYESKYIKFFVLLTITHLINIYNWWWYPSLPILKTLLNLDPFIRFISVINIFLLFSILFLQLSSYDHKKKSN